MSQLQQALDYQREMVMESCYDIAAGKGRDCNEFFEELEKRYTNGRV